MRKADLQHNHQALDSAVSRYRTFMDKIINAQSVISTAQEKRDMAESVMLRLCAHWEYFVDEHLVDCVNCDNSKMSEFLGASIPSNPSKSLCQALIFGDSYRDFRSFGDLKGFTKRILPDNSNPFLEIKPGHSEKIDELYKIRNYLSHYSGKAKRSLQKMYENKYGLERFYEPGYFLLANSAYRLWSYFNAFEGASVDMKAWYLLQ